MKIKYFICPIFIIIILISSGTISAIATKASSIMDRQIEPNDHIYCYCTTYDPEDDMSENIDIVFTSNIPVDFYIFKSRNLNVNSPDYSKAEYTVLNTTYLNFTYTLTDETSYNYIFNNPNDSEASIHCETTEYGQIHLSGSSNDSGISILFILSIIILIVILAIIGIIYMVFRNRKQHEMDHRTFYQDPPSQRGYYQTSQQYPSEGQYPDYYDREQEPPKPPLQQY